METAGSELDKHVAISAPPDPQNDQSASETSPSDDVETEEENIRTIYLRKAINKVAHKCLSAGRFSMFAKAYKSVCKKNPKALKSIVEQLNTQMEKGIEMEIQTMFDEENLPGTLTNFDKLIKEAPPANKSWRPSGDPEKDVIAYTIPELSTHKAKLEEILVDMENDNKQLTSAVIQRRKYLAELQRQIQETANEIEEVANVCNDFELWEERLFGPQ